MQTQDAPAEIIFKLWPWLEANKKGLIGGLVGIIVVSGIVYFISAQRAQKEVDAGRAVTSVMMNSAMANNNAQEATQFEQLAEKYAGTAAGQRAQVQAAAALFDAANYADAQTQFQKYLDANSSGVLAATAELGLAASLEAQNKLDLAAAAYQRVISVFSSSTCVPQAEFALGRIAEQQKKLSEAVTHYENVTRAGFAGSLANEAAIRAAELKTKIPAAAPKAEAVPAKPAASAAPPVAAPAAATKPAVKP